jgi:hypothetical protein
MRNFIAIAKYEWKMQIKSPGFWVILLFVLIIGGLDTFPTAENMARLDNQLQNSGYVVSRLLTHVVLMMFGFVFMTASRIQRDKKLGISELQKGQYVAGKFYFQFVRCAFGRRSVFCDKRHCSLNLQSGSIRCASILYWIYLRGNTYGGFHDRVCCFFACSD